jgi:hypothetical protein
MLDGVFVVVMLFSVILCGLNSFVSVNVQLCLLNTSLRYSIFEPLKL